MEMAQQMPRYVAELAAQLARSGTAAAIGEPAGTARNWATVTRLLALLQAS